MTLRRAIASAITAVALLLGGVVSATSATAASGFSDVSQNSQFAKEIQWLANEGISTGYADGTFRPFGAITRDAMAAFMYRLAGKPSFTAPKHSPFSDVTPSTQFYKEITWLASTGVSTGWTKDNTYRPHWNIARNAMAAFMYRFDSRVGAADLKVRELVTGPGVVTRNGSKVVIGDGTRASCTSAAVARAVRGGGDVTFKCGSKALTIKLTETLMTCNTHNCAHPWRGGTPVSRLTLDGGGLVTLSGGGSRGIFYANTCEESFGWLSSSCDKDTTPHITFRNIGFTQGNATTSPAGVDPIPGGGGGGAIAMRGGQLTVQDAWFTSNRCVSAHSDAGGGAIRAMGVSGGVTISNSRFSDNKCANGGAVSSLQSPMSITGSTFTGNVATGYGASDGKGGNGGAVYFDGTNQNVTISRSTITGNKAPEGGPAVFYVSNNNTGSLTIQNSTLTGNTGQKFYTSPYRSIFFKGKNLKVSGGTVT